MKRLIIMFVAVFILDLSPCFAQELTGKVIGITDGDTFTLLLPEKKSITIRLAEIDAPEKNQAFGNASKQMLASLIFWKIVTVEKKDVDRYRRIVGRVYFNSKDINLAMVSEGAAWAYLKYVTDQKFIYAEAAARRQKKGLWKLQPDQIIPPWEWRKSKAAVLRQMNLEAPSLPLNCGQKRYCSQMTSCSEAKYHLTVCLLHRLDGDNDGIPCEALCQ